MKNTDKVVISLEQTVKALADLRAHWESEGCPSPAKIAKIANVSSATAHRYLSGATKGGFPETIRALAIAMGRSDIAESIPFTSINGNGRAGDYVVELGQQYQEKLQQQLAEADARHKQEMDAVLRDHRAERENWHTLCKKLNEENANLRESFDQTSRIQYREKWIAYALLVAAVMMLIIVK